MPLLGDALVWGTLVLTYSATNLVTTQKDQPHISSKRRPHSVLERTNIWSRVPKPRTAVLARTTSNLMDLKLSTNHARRN
jgi:hypothetical protein